MKIISVLHQIGHNSLTLYSIGQSDYRVFPDSNGGNNMEESTDIFNLLHMHMLLLRDNEL